MVEFRTYIYIFMSSYNFIGPVDAVHCLNMTVLQMLNYILNAVSVNSEYIPVVRGCEAGQGQWRPLSSPPLTGHRAGHTSVYTYTDINQHQAIC